MYGELHEVGEMPPGEVLPGERRPYELADVGCMEAVDMYELERDPAAGDMDETDEACGIAASRGVGEPREPTSLRRTTSLWSDI